eukprot:1353884-Rhodomonas_salina.1
MSQAPGPGSNLNHPGEHAEHGADPAVSLNVPAAHAVQGPPSGPRYPTLQVQLDTWVPLAEAGAVKLMELPKLAATEPDNASSQKRS